MDYMKKDKVMAEMKKSMSFKKKKRTDKLKSKDIVMSAEVKGK